MGNPAAALLKRSHIQCLSGFRHWPFPVAPGKLCLACGHGPGNNSSRAVGGDGGCKTSRKRAEQPGAWTTEVKPTDRLSGASHFKAVQDSPSCLCGGLKIATIPKRVLGSLMG